MKLLTNVLKIPVNASLLVPNIFLSILLLSTLSQCPSFGMRGQFSHPYKATCSMEKEMKIISWEKDFLYTKGIASAVKRVEFVSNRLSYSSGRSLV